MSIAVGVNEKQATTTLTNASSSSDTSAADLQSNFLTLLVTQLQNQDPTNPMDNSQLTSQLAQINTLSGIEKLNTTLGSISGQITSGQSLQASGVHTFQWDGKAADGTTAADGKYSVTISASNATGQLVAQPLNYAYVSGVSSNASGAVLDLGTMGTTTLENVRQII